MQTIRRIEEYRGEWDGNGDAVGGESEANRRLEPLAEARYRASVRAYASLVALLLSSFVYVSVDFYSKRREALLKKQPATPA